MKDFRLLDGALGDVADRQTVRRFSRHLRASDEQLLMNEPAETAYNAARILGRWRTLTRIFYESKGIPSILNMTSRLYVTNFLERPSLASMTRSQLTKAVKLAQRAGREELQERFERRIKSASLLIDSP